MSSTFLGFVQSSNFREWYILVGNVSEQKWNWKWSQDSMCPQTPAGVLEGALTSGRLGVSVSSSCCVTKCHTLGGLKNRRLSLTVLKTGKPLVKIPDSLFLGRASPWLIGDTSLLSPHMMESASSGLSSFSYRHINPSKGVPSTWLHLNLITSQMPHLQMLSRWELGLQHMNFEGHKHSVQHTSLPVHSANGWARALNQVTLIVGLVSSFIR